MNREPQRCPHSGQPTTPSAALTELADAGRAAQQASANLAAVTRELSNTMETRRAHDSRDDL